MANALNKIAKLKTNQRKRVGRGIGSGSGKTSGRGVKGQKARTGKNMNGFEGGQTPIYMRLPKRGFKNFCAKAYETVNIKDFLVRAEKNKLDSKEVVTKEKLLDLGLIRDKDSKVKLIMSGIEAEKKVGFKFQVDSYSKTAQVLAA